MGTNKRTKDVRIRVEGVRREKLSDHNVGQLIDALAITGTNDRRKREGKAPLTDEERKRLLRLLAQDRRAIKMRSEAKSKPGAVIEDTSAYVLDPHEPAPASELTTEPELAVPLQLRNSILNRWRRRSRAAIAAWRDAR